MSMASVVTRAWTPGPQASAGVPAAPRHMAMAVASGAAANGEGMRGRVTGVLLCGVGSVDPGHGYQPDLGRSRRAQGARAGPGRRAGRVDVVDENDHAPGHPRPVAHGKGAGGVGPPPGRV